MPARPDPGSETAAVLAGSALHHGDGKVAICFQRVGQVQLQLCIGDRAIGGDNDLVALKSQVSGNTQ